MPINIVHNYSFRKLKRAENPLYSRYAFFPARKLSTSNDTDWQPFHLILEDTTIICS